MISDRKKPGVAFWLTVVVAVIVVAYPLSLGPAMWLAVRMDAPGWVFDALETSCGLVLYLAVWSGPFGEPYLRYLGWWHSHALSG
jgi:hypothetical protein